VHQLSAATTPGHQRDPRMRGHRRPRRDTGDDFERHPRLGAGQRLVRPGGVRERVATEQAHDVTSVLGRLHDAAPPRRGGESHAFVVDTDLDDIDGLRCMRQGRTVGGLVDDDDIRAFERLDRPDGEQPRVAGAGADKRDATFFGALVRTSRSGHGTISSYDAGSLASTTAPAPSPSSSCASSRPSCSALFTGPVADLRILTAPSRDATTARTYSSRPFSPSAASAYAPTGAVQPASSVARRERSAVTAARVPKSSSVARTAARSASSERHSTPRAPWPGAGRT